MTFFFIVKFDPGILLYFLIGFVIVFQSPHAIDCKKKSNHHHTTHHTHQHSGGKRASISRIKPAARENVIEEKKAFLLKKKLHKLKFLTQKAIKRLSDTADFDEFNSNYLKNILRVRVPGTVGHHEVKEFIIGKLKDNGWHIDLDEFMDATPFGERKFTNIIATLNPDADRKLAIAAHYDSKVMTPENDRYFVAASDSAVPCAMMLDFAKLLSEKAKQLKKDLSDVSPMLLFLDGEEAFVEWTKNDSIYGSRHLAQMFSNKTHHKKSFVSVSDSIDAFMLLDLLGMANPQFYDMYPQTSQLYNRLHDIEFSMKSAGEITNQFPYFVGRAERSMYIEDDHIPFLQKGIPILHIIPVPFPEQWHKLSDDADALDPSTIRNLLKIFRQFLLEYFHLS